MFPLAREAASLTVRIHTSSVRGALDMPGLAGESALAGDDEALDALAASLERVGASESLDDALVEIAQSTAATSGAELVVVRVGSGPTGDLVACVVVAESPALAAELEGSRLPAEEAARIGEGALDLGTAPGSIRRAAARAGAGAACVVPLTVDGGPAATLEVYATGPLSPREESLARLAAAQVAVALRLHPVPGTNDAQPVRNVLDAAGDALAAGSDEREAADYVVRLAAEATGATGAILWRLEAETPPAFLAALGFDDELPDLRAAAAAVERAVSKRSAGEGTSGSDSVVLLGEPPAGALQLSFDGAEPPRMDIERLSAFAARAAVALRRARRSQLLGLALRRSQTLVAVVSQAIAQLSLAHTLETAVDRISELTASGQVAIYLREGERLVDAVSRGLAGAHSELAERLLELALGPSRGRGFLFIEDLSRDPRLNGLEDVLLETGVRRALVIPLLARDEVIGVLTVYKTRARPYREGEEGLLIALSTQLAVAVQNARLHERTKELGAVLERSLEAERQAARQLRGLFQISHSFAHSLSLEATLDAVARAMVELFDVDAAAIRMPDERAEQLVTRTVYVADPNLRGAAVMILARPQPMAAPLARRLLRSGAPVLLAPGSVDGSDVHRLLEPFLVKGSTAAVLPMATPGEVLGTITLLSLDPARRLDPEAVEIAMTVAPQAALAIDNARLYQQQKDFSETMQRSLLPQAIPEIPGLEIGHVYASSARVDVGGDVYDFMELEDGTLAVVLGDVTGKGIQAAADMALAKFAFRSLARNHPEPAAFLANANEVAVDELATGKFITMLYVRVDPRSREATCASAGHPSVRVVTAGGEVGAVDARGLALGIDSGQEYPEKRVTLEPGSSLVLYTDGVLEARRNGELYGEERLDALLHTHTDGGAQELAEAILADCRSFAGGELGDDCAVVVVRVAP
ncbi:MAG: GAF domain-containing protein [Actinobacteria bacterium]|nr:MAG: GAF domain-containing protein [Actinomycetota bacterium]